MNVHELLDLTAKYPAYQSEKRFWKAGQHLFDKPLPPERFAGGWSTWTNSQQKYSLYQYHIEHIEIKNDFTCRFLPHLLSYLVTACVLAEIFKDLYRLLR